MAMNKRLPRLRSLLSLLLLLLTAGVLFLIGGCAGDGENGVRAETEGSEKAATSDAKSEGETPEVHTYRVRGEIKELPDPNDPLSGLYIRHEAIDEFVTMEGEVRGMDAMTMPFMVADQVSFEGIEVGDKVAFTLTVSWDADPSIQVTEVDKLPTDTQLDFRKAD